MWHAKDRGIVAEYFKKGSAIGLEGRLQVRTYDDEHGQKHWITEVIAEQVEFVERKGSESGLNQDLGQEIVFDDEDLPF